MCQAAGIQGYDSTVIVHAFTKGCVWSYIQGELDYLETTTKGLNGEILIQCSIKVMT